MRRRRGQVWCTSTVPLSESLDFWHDAVLATLVGMDISAEGGTYVGTMRVDHIGDLQLSTVECDPGVVHRSPRFIARGDGRDVFAAVLTRGLAQVEQDGRSTEMRPGDVVFFETVRPFLTRFPQRFQLKIFAVPRDLLGLPDADLSKITARSLRPAAGLGAVLSPFMSRLADTSESYAQPVADQLADTAVHLLAAAAAQQLGDEPSSLPGADRVLLLRIHRYIRWHLSDPELSPETIARAHHISVRYVHRLFEAEGTTVSRWVRALRMQECRRELTDAAARSVSVGSVARRWGFTSTSHFGRAFRREYGTSPTEWLHDERGRRPVEEER
ncbi:helix-turn-helix domain-containing protein [Streptomyces sp. ISL-36]|uniref:helix-turn-helix domain-containing protein n=1 Tax=Streptomyces sp. ISL-36 TaxID=2819182 RepID=UPI00203595FF|nr:helix-turn-helix domain-containing protein [Streptomyces sp. ISL-36]